MRVPTALLAAVAAIAALAAVAPVAAADPPAPSLCWPADELDGPNSYDQTFSRLGLGKLLQEAIPLEQRGIIRVGPENGMYTVNLAPGALDLTGARAAIEQRLRGALSPADADGAMAALRLWPVPFPYSQVQAAVSPVTRTLSEAGIEHTETFAMCRIYVRLNLPNGRAELDRARQLVAPFGDMVYVEWSGRYLTMPGPGVRMNLPGGPSGPMPDPPPLPTTPTPAGGGGAGQAQPGGTASKPGADKGTGAGTGTGTGTKRLAISTVLRAPSAKRCVRGSAVTLRPRAGARLSVTVRGRTQRGRAGRAVRVTLRGAKTTVTVKATARDGRSATQRLTYRRCAAKR